MRGLVVFGMLVAMVTTASADEASERIAATKAMLEAQRAALLKDDATAFEATFTKDAVWSLGLDAPRPGGSGTQFLLTWPTKLTIATAKIGWAGSWGWVAAELKATPAAHPESGSSRPGPTVVLHWVALVVPEGAGVKTRALRLMRTKADKALTTYNHVQEMVPVTAMSPLTSALAQPKVLMTKLSKDPATTLLGSAPGDRAFGPAAVKEMLGAWGKLTLEVSTAKDVGERRDYDPVEIAVGDAMVSWATVRMKQSGTRRWVQLDAFAVARKVGDSFELVALEYGVDDNWE